MYSLQLRAYYINFKLSVQRYHDWKSTAPLVAPSECIKNQYTLCVSCQTSSIHCLHDICTFVISLKLLRDVCFTKEHCFLSYPGQARLSHIYTVRHPACLTDLTQMKLWGLRGSLVVPDIQYQIFPFFFKDRRAEGNFAVHPFRRESGDSLRLK